MSSRIALTISLLPVTVIKPALFALLMVMVGFPQLPATGLVPACITAITMSSVAGSANEEGSSAFFAEYLKKYNKLCDGRHPLEEETRQRPRIMTGCCC
jgi:hypothetical protein